VKDWWDRVSGAQRRRAEWTRRAFEEIEALEHASTGPRDWRAPVVKRRRRHGGLAVLVLVVGGAVAVSQLTSDEPAPEGPLSVWMPGIGSRSLEHPADARDERLLPVPTPPEPAAGSFAFLSEADGRLVTYDPCVPIHVRINPRTGGHDAVTLVEAAVDEVQAATGLEFVVDGLTDEEPRFDAATAQDRTVLVGWSDPDRVPKLAGDVAGLGGSAAVEDGRGAVYVSGQVALDGPSLAAYDEADQVAVIMHELGHVVGLDHVDDPDELMYEENRGRREWGPGDRYGLALLGSGPCR